MKQLVINIPDFIDLDEREVTLTLATKLYEEGKLSAGHAAELAGVTKRAFIELLGSFNVSVFNYPASDLESDLRNA